MKKRNLDTNQGDQRGSVRHQIEAGLKRRDRRKADKKMGKNYFTNPKEKKDD